MIKFGEGPGRLRFELCKARLIYATLLKDLLLNGSIQAAASCHSPDPLLKNAFLDIFSCEYNNPLRLDINGYQFLDNIRPCSLPVSSNPPVVQIAAKLYVTTDTVRDVETSAHIDDDDDDAHLHVDDDDWVMDDATVAYYSQNTENHLDVFDLFDNITNSEIEAANREKPDVDINNEAFEVCNDCVSLNLSNIPNGGSGRITIEGKDGALMLYYLALKNAVDADLKVEFFAPSMETKIYGSVVAYFGKNFEYGGTPDLYELTLFKKKRSASVGSGNINLMRSALAVPANSSLKIEANLCDDTSGNEILSGTCEITVGLDGKPTVGSIASEDYTLNVLVNWKMPSEELKIPFSPIYPPALASNSVVSRLTKRRKYGAHYTSSMADHSSSSMTDHFTSSMADHSTFSMTDPNEHNRWSLQEELENVFNALLHRLFNPQEAVSCTISTCTKEDGGDYLCSSVMHIWPECRKTCSYRGPKRAGLALKNIMDSEYKDMMESCVVCGPGFVKFKLSKKWITTGINRMLTTGIETWAPKLTVKKTVIYCLSQNIWEEMHMGHLRSTFIGETLARVLNYCGVVVILKRIINDDLPNINHLDIKAVTEGQNSPNVDLNALRHALDVEKADWIVHVTDEGKRVSIEMCIIAARHANLILEDPSKCPLSHVGFGLVQEDDFKQPFVSMLDIAKRDCKDILARKGIADAWTAAEIEHAAEALGIGAIKYAGLKNNRLTNYTFSLAEMLNEKGDTAVYLQFTHVRICSCIKMLKAEELQESILKNDDERELGLHLLRFSEVLEEVCTLLTPHILCQYIYGLCVKFNSLETSARQDVMSSEETSYLSLCEATDAVIRKCFDLLGITPICKT